MKKYIFSLLILFTLSINAQSKKIEVKLHSIEGYGEYENFAKQATELLEEVLNSDEFRNEILNGVFKKTNNLTNQQLFDSIMKAHEKKGLGGKDGVVDLRIRTLELDGKDSYWKNKCHRSTIGIDGNGDGVTAICPNKLKNWYESNRLDQLAGHFMHEYMHIIGFDHYKFLSTQSWREKTFVYMAGKIVSKLVRKKIEIND